ncbi:MAG: lipocalin family protein [Maritimibacter sp.]
MYKFSRFLAISLAFMALNSAPAKAEVYRDQSVPITSVEELDINQYLGLWYEIARFPNWFERDCQGVTAEYALRDDGKISVRNTCHKGAPDGPEKVANGLAWKAAPGQLKVTFTPLLPFINGDYWVLYVDPDYQVAVVGSPAGKTGWVLARSPDIAPAVYDKAVSVLTAMGYDISKLELIAH